MYEETNLKITIKKMLGVILNPIRYTHTHLAKINVL
ncbi:hypothetical protein [Bacillus amyloliquefaciens]